MAATTLTNGATASLTDRIVGLLHRHPVLSMGALVVAGMALTLWHLSRLSSRLVDSAALQGTALYTDALSEFRTLYTSEVIVRLAGRAVEVTHAYREKEGAIPLPATLSMELGRAIGDKGSGMEVRLYSAHPFPWRKGTGGPQDEFERAALDALSRDPQTPFYRFEEAGGRVALRYATADLMRPTCVGCHNSHPNSPKRDWKAGDVRGVLSVTRPLDHLRAETRSGLRDTLGLMLGMTLSGLALLAVVVGRLRRTAGQLEERMRELQASETRLRVTNEQLQVAHDEALAANQAKSEFLATMSHELRTPLNVGTMRGDVTKIRQSLLNLFSNACKFTQNGRVTLQVKRRQDASGPWIEFEVKDTGIGTPKEHLDRLFASFSMGDASSTRKHGGTGLGLVLTRRFSQMLGGDVTVESEVAKGSTFTIHVPARTAPGAPES